jgi:hypothetical protein
MEGCIFLTPGPASQTIVLILVKTFEDTEMNQEFTLREGVELNLADVEKIAIGLKSLAAYSMLAYEHDDDPQDLEEVVQEGLDAIDRLFNC